MIGAVTSAAALGAAAATTDATLAALVDRAQVAAALDVSDIVFIIIALLSLLSSFFKNLKKTKKENEEEESKWRELMEQRAEEAERRAAERKRAPSPAAPSAPTIDAEEAWDEETWDEEEQVAREVAPLPPSPLRETPVLDAEARHAVEQIERLVAEAEGLEPRWRDAVVRARVVPALARAVTLADARFTPTVSDVLLRLRQARRAIEDGAVGANAGWIPLAVELHSLASAAEFVHRAATQRLGAAGDRTLSRVDALAASLTRRLPGLARLGSDLVAARPIVVIGERDELAARSLVSLDVLPIWLAVDPRRQPGGLAGLAGEIGRAMLSGSPALRDEVRAALGAPERGDLPSGEGAIYLQDIERLLGSWYPTLFGDVFGVTLLGPAYVSGLLSQLAARRGAHHWTTIRRGPDGLGAADEPPGMVRLAAALSAVRALDGLDDEADRLEAAAPWPLTGGEIQLPLRNGVTIDAPAGHFRGVAERAAATLMDAELDALGDVSLRQFAAPGWDGDLQFRMLRAGGDMLAGKVADVAPRVALAAALRADEVGQEDAGALLDTLLGVTVGALAAAAGAETDLRETLARPTRRHLVDAMAFRAVFDE